jgi:capsular polysaccharide transport system ATP-binding protein
MIRFKRVTKRFPLRDGQRKTIVEGLSMTLPRGRNLALLGRNGAGKSTFLQLISGATKPDEGVVRRDCRVSWPLGFSGSFHGALTGIQNIRFVARVYGADVDALIAYVAEFSELGPYLHEPVRTYSSGMKARLAFGVSMGVRFDVYLVDEVTAVGDQTFKTKCRDAFEYRLADADVIMVSHGVPTLRTFCDCGLVLENGRLNFYEDIDEAIERHDANMRGAAAA